MTYRNDRALAPLRINAVLSARPGPNLTRWEALEIAISSAPSWLAKAEYATKVGLYLQIGSILEAQKPKAQLPNAWLCSRAGLRRWAQRVLQCRSALQCMQCCNDLGTREAVLRDFCCQEITIWPLPTRPALADARNALARGCERQASVESLWRQDGKWDEVLRFRAPGRRRIGGGYHVGGLWRLAEWRDGYTAAGRNCAKRRPQGIEFRRRFSLCDRCLWGNVRALIPGWRTGWKP